MSSSPPRFTDPAFYSTLRFQVERDLGERYFFQVDLVDAPEYNAPFQRPCYHICLLIRIRLCYQLSRPARSTSRFKGAEYLQLSGLLKFANSQVAAA